MKQSLIMVKKIDQNRKGLIFATIALGLALLSAILLPESANAQLTFNSERASQCEVNETLSKPFECKSNKIKH